MRQSLSPVNRRQVQEWPCMTCSLSSNMSLASMVLDHPPEKQIQISIVPLLGLKPWRTWSFLAQNYEVRSRQDRRVTPLPPPKKNSPGFCLSCTVWAWTKMLRLEIWKMWPYICDCLSCSWPKGPRIQAWASSYLEVEEAAISKLRKQLSRSWASSYLEALTSSLLLRTAVEKSTAARSVPSELPPNKTATRNHTSLWCKGGRH